MADKSVVLVARRWDNPTIEVTVNAEGISIAMPLTEFLSSIAAEVGSPAMLLLTTGSLQRELQRACDVVTTEMKAATRQVI
jgi:hypothetical protein